MSDARDLFEDEPGRPDVAAAILRELESMRRILEAIRADLEAIRQEIEASAAGRPMDASLSAAAAPLAAGGGASYPGFPESFRGRTGGGR